MITQSELFNQFQIAFIYQDLDKILRLIDIGLDPNFKGGRDDENFYSIYKMLCEMYYEEVYKSESKKVTNFTESIANKFKSMGFNEIVFPSDLILGNRAFIENFNLKSRVEKPLKRKPEVLKLLEAIELVKAGSDSNYSKSVLSKAKSLILAILED